MRKDYEWNLELAGKIKGVKAIASGFEWHESSSISENLVFYKNYLNSHFNVYFYEN
ncbi:MAG: hypothetical protein HKN23_20335 [Verrucomicrobiales bacterium]|nr:hypothetical protein [Verrucomicrobiales bacterium]